MNSSDNRLWFITPFLDSKTEPEQDGGTDHVLLITKFITIKSPVHCEVKGAVWLKNAKSNRINHDASICLYQSYG